MRVHGLRGALEVGACVAVLVMSGCRGSQYPPGAIGIHCTDRSNDCDEKMQRQCPNGYTTMDVQKLRVKDVAYGQDVLELTYVIKCKIKEEAALPPCRREIVTAVAPAGVATYETRATSGGVRGDAAAKRIERVLLDIAAQRGLSIEADGRLATLGEYFLSAFVSSRHPPSDLAIDAASRRVGLVDRNPSYSLFTPRDDARVEKNLTELFDSANSNVKFNRYGVVATPDASVVLLAETAVVLEPVPRRAAPGETLALRGQLTRGRMRAHGVVTTPDGAEQSLGQSESAQIDFAVPVPKKGVYQVELLADGPSGVEVVANFPVFVGVEEPEPPNGVACDEMPATAGPLAIIARLLELVNAERARVGAPKVQLHDGLSALAQAHSSDMVERNFFGHASEKNGDLPVRAERAGLAFPAIGENLGRAGTAEQVHRGLLASPAHRGNILNPAWSVVGIGVAIDTRDSEAAIVATQEFGGSSSRIDAEATRTRLLDEVNRKRVAAGATALKLQRTLAAIAQAGADRYFAEPGVKEPQILEGLNRHIDETWKKRPPPLAQVGATRSIVALVYSIDAVSLERVLDPGFRFIGVGVAQGTRPDTGPNAVAVVLVIGEPR
jgi:uncharacterized protein YkwD